MKKIKYRILNVIETKGDSVKSYNVIRYNRFFVWWYLSRQGYGKTAPTLFLKNASRFKLLKICEPKVYSDTDNYSPLYENEMYAICKIHAQTFKSTEFTVTIEKEIEL